MKHSILVLITMLLTLQLGCATKPKNEAGLTVEQQRFLQKADSTNDIIRGTERKRRDTMKDFSKEDYLKIVQGFSNGPGKEYATGLREYKIVSFSSSEDGFVVCAFSQSQRMGFCDDASCMAVEFSGPMQESTVLNTWAKQLPLHECKKP